MDTEELRESIARFVGFTTGTIEYHDPMSGREFEGSDFSIPYWIAPTKERYKYSPPDFPSNFNACLEWVLPELNKRGVYLIVSQYFEDESFGVVLVGTGPYGKDFKARGLSLSLAFCEAVGKYLEYIGEGDGTMSSKGEWSVIEKWSISRNRQVTVHALRDGKGKMLGYTIRTEGWVPREEDRYQLYEGDREYASCIGSVSTLEEAKDKLAKRFRVKGRRKLMFEEQLKKRLVGYFEDNGLQVWQEVGGVDRPIDKACGGTWRVLDERRVVEDIIGIVEQEGI